MRFARYLLPGLPICAGLLLIVFLSFANATGSDVLFFATFTVIIITTYLFYPYLSAWGSPTNLQLEHGLELSITHWVIVFIIYLFISRKLNDRLATILGCSISAASIFLAYIGLALLGYHVEMHIDF